MNEEKVTSISNEGSNQISRIESLLSSIQVFSLNLVVPHAQLNNRCGYQILPELYDGLILELIPFLLPVEEEKVMNYRVMIKQSLITNPILRQGMIKDQVFISQKNLTIIKELFFDFEVYLRKLLAKYEIINLKKSHEEKIR